MQPSRTAHAAALGGFLILAFGAAALGALFPPGEWYAGLEKPFFNPPNWIFGPVWTVLYLLIGIAGFVIWRATRREGPAELRRRARRALAAFFVQLALNAAWSWLFFGLERPDWAFAEILVLWIAIALTIRLARPASPAAAWLLAPYLAWVSFAAVLNGALFWLNR